MPKPVIYLPKFDEDQPRDENGRWTDAGGGGGSGGGGGGGGDKPTGNAPAPSAEAPPRGVTRTAVSAGTREELQRALVDLKDQSVEFDERELDAVYMIESIIDDTKLTPATVAHIDRARDGSIISGIVYYPQGRSVTIDAIASLRRGEGTRLVREAERFAAGRQMGVYLEALPQAVGFFERLGYSAAGRPGRWNLTPMRKPYSALAAAAADAVGDEDIGLLAASGRYPPPSKKAGVAYLSR